MRDRISRSRADGRHTECPRRTDESRRHSQDRSRQTSLRVGFYVSLEPHNPPRCLKFFDDLDEPGLHHQTRIGIST